MKFYSELFPLVLCVGSRVRKTEQTQSKTHKQLLQRGWAHLGCPKRVFPKAPLAERGTTHTFTNREGKTQLIPAKTGEYSQGECLWLDLSFWGRWEFCCWFHWSQDWSYVTSKLIRLEKLFKNMYEKCENMHWTQQKEVRQGVNQECLSIPLNFACLAAHLASKWRERRKKKIQRRTKKTIQRDYSKYPTGVTAVGSVIPAPSAHGHRGFGLISWGGALTQNRFDFKVISKDGALPTLPKNKFPNRLERKGLFLLLPSRQGSGMDAAHAQKEMEFSALFIWRDFLQWQSHLVYFHSSIRPLSPPPSIRR